VALMTNNPAKVDGLRELGVEVTARIPVVVPTNPLSAAYLDTKRRRMAHVLPARRALLMAARESYTRSSR
jgi:GTP cyclohydrolase II